MFQLINFVKKSYINFFLKLLPPNLLKKLKYTLQIILLLLHVQDIEINNQLV
jgi:hypothetical protein